MAEIRKFDPAAGNAIAQALKAAMGEPVRPAEPGTPAAPRKPAPQPPPAATWLTLNVVTDAEPED